MRPSGRSPALQPIGARRSGALTHRTLIRSRFAILNTLSLLRFFWWSKSAKADVALEAKPEPESLGVADQGTGSGSPPRFVRNDRAGRTSTTRPALAICSGMAMLLTSMIAAKAGGNLFIYNWTDYTSPALIQKFEKETGIKVTVDTYDSNETLLAKLKSGATGYDIVVISSDFVPIFIKEKLIQAIDAPKMAAYGNIAQRWQSPAWDPGNAYTIPFGWGITSYVVNTKAIKEPTVSLGLLFDPPPEAKGKVGMMSAPSEVVSLAELYLGLPPCQEDPAAMKQVYALLEKQAPSVKIYASDGIIEREASGETWLHEMWNGDAARAHIANPDISFVFAKEGGVGWMDNVAIPVGAKDAANARLFLQFMLKPENSALSANFTHYASAIAGTEPFLDPAMREAPAMKIPADYKIVFTPTCSEAAIKLIDRVWTKLKR